MFRLIRKSVFLGIGMQEKAREIAEELIKRGEGSEGKRAKVIKEMVDKGANGIKDIKQKVCDLACNGAEQANISTKSDLDRLEKGIKDLSSRLSRLEERGQKV